MTLAYLGIGSNQDARQAIPEGIHALTEYGCILRTSPIYRSPAMGFQGADFYNLVLEMETELNLTLFAQGLRTIEYQCGRSAQAAKNQDRRLDIDILLFGEQVSTQKPIVPRPDIYHCPFVIQPLYDLRPDLILSLIHI